MKHQVDQLLEHRRIRQALLAVLIFSVALGLLIVPVERVNGNIQTFEDGLYWAVTTVSGVGYGDLHPVTTLGRIIAMTLQICGVLILGLLVSFVANVLTTRQEFMYWSRSFDRLNDLQAKLDNLEAKIDFLVREEAEKKKKQ